MSQRKNDRIAGAQARLRSGKTSDAEALAVERERGRSRAQERERRKVMKGLEKELKILETRQAFIDHLADAPDPKPFKIRKHKGQGRRSPAATYCMNASDWHMGERVRPENVGWRNEYDPGIAQERAEKFWDSQLTMLSAARAAWDIRQGVLWLGGDLMTGYIHEEYEEENFLSPVEESLLVYKTMVSGIRHILATSDLEHILIPTSNGNHGRTGRKIRIATYAKNSFEWMLYQYLALAFDDEPRIKFQISNGYNNLVDLYGTRINYHHGDAVKFAGGVGGPTIALNKRIGRIAAGVPKRWEGTDKGAPHLYVQGHLHSLMYPKGSIYNGSLIGWNDFAEWIGAGYEDPMQTSFVVDERYGIVSNFNPIIVTKRR